ncbi:peroxiredoxin Q/BCP [Tindallia californiensis]|uniref:Bacterioferritin comigratory protein n=1 Tax=Tindallia californiensis TaxID=159292 RepID=A0A1H3JNC7_9FIRM|nr:peroxiredoxin Q/BCP [Tindallia californiensis]
MNTVILGVSRDSLKSHQKFSQKHNLPFSLLVDDDEFLHNQFDVIKEKKLFGKKGLGTERSTFLINEMGILIEEYRKVKAKGHAEEMLKKIEIMEK